MPPRHIGPYLLLNPLGSGGVGTVYRAQDQRNGDTVALKLLSTGGALDPLAARRLAREFETLHDLNHPNIVRVFDAGVHHGYPYLAMELIEGLDLRRYLNVDASPVIVSLPIAQSSSSDAALDIPRFDLDSLAAEMDTDAMGLSFVGDGPREIRALADAADESNTDDSGEVPFHTASEAAEIEAPHPQPLCAVDLAMLNRPERVGRLKDALLQICEALAYMHARGLVHRDLKPANVMVDDDRRVRLMDFGLAKFLAEDNQVTASGKVVGTYRYMSPEQLTGEQLDHRADLYSLGVVIYELVSGRAPFSARSPLELWNLVLNQEPPPLLALNPEADEQLVRVSQRLLRKEASKRFQTAEEVFQVLLDS